MYEGGYHIYNISLCVGFEMHTNVGNIVIRISERLSRRREAS